MNIPIATVKRWREEVDATHLVVFAMDRDGNKQHVATHGETAQNATEAAKAGNKLKGALGWPDELCHAKPLARICKNCTYYKPDYGIHCMNGWSGDGSRGWCQYEPTRIGKGEDCKCSCFEPNQ